MTTYNTGNTLGSVDVYDRYDNSENFDYFSNGPLDAYPDRFGVSRQSLQGIRNASQYVDLGPYAASLVFTSRNQVFSYLGEFYAPGPSITLPYTTTGAGAGEIATFRSVGDATLRSDLDDGVDPAKGAALVGYKGRTVFAKLSEVVSVKDFGAVGDGVTDDTAAIKNALAAVANGGTVNLAPGKTYLISQTIVLTRPVNIYGGAKENTTLLFSSSGAYLSAPWKCGMIAVHSSTAIPSNAGDARRSVLSGFTLRMQPGVTAMGGFIAATPVYLREVDAYGFSSDGFAVMAAGNASSPIQGNANGTTFSNCISQSNGGSGFYLTGDDANACLFVGCRAPTNIGYGFYDNSLLGNTYVGCETDGNTGGGYFSTNGKPNRSSYLGCYSEGNQTPVWNIGERCLRIGSQGDQQNLSSVTGLALSSMPSGDGYLNHGMVWASTDDIANSLSGGAYSRISLEGFEFLGSSVGRKFKVNQLSSSYVDLSSADLPTLRFPNIDVTGNIKVGRPYAPMGLSLGATGRSAIVGADTAAPTTGTYDRGAILLNDLPAAGGFVGWVCVTAGSPGTWKTFGAISA